MEQRELVKEFNDNDAGLGYTLYVIIGVVCFVIARALIVSGVEYNGIFSFVYAFIVEAIFAFSVALVCLIKKRDFIPATGVNKPVNAKMFVICIVISLVCLFGLGRVSDFFIDILSYFGYHTQTSSLQVKTVLDLLKYTFLVAVLPAFCEELLFRGLILNGLRKYGAKVAIFFSAFAFMIMHGSPDQTVHQFILGVIFGFIVYYTRNIWLTIIIHFFNNFIVLVITFISSLGEVSGETVAGVTTPSTANSVVVMITSYAINVAIVVLSAFIIVKSVQYLIKEVEKKNTPAEEAVEAEAEIEEVADSERSIVVEKSAPPVMTPLEQKPRMDVLTLAMFVVTSAYLVLEWITALVEGFSG
ncbi:MAG: CPBP family intramembrane metalloprotease [Clostridia bacterium]|nr:CPBP family intramembrane metalloprotease [Clostridia bacterium]